MIFAVVVTTKKGMIISDPIQKEGIQIKGATVLRFDNMEEYEKAKTAYDKMNANTIKEMKEQPVDENDVFINAPDDQKGMMIDMIKAGRHKDVMVMINKMGCSNLNWCCARQNKLLEKVFGI